MLTNPVFAAWTQQGLNLSPSPIWVVLGYGLMIVFAVLGIKRAWRHEASRFVVLWCVLNLAAIYVPFSLQRRLISGFQVPLATLAAIGLVQVLTPWLWRVWPRRLAPHGRYSRRGLTRLLLFGAMVLMMPTNLVILERYRVSYVLYGPNGRALGGFDPETAVYLRRAAVFDTYLVYAVVL